jgi:hypothetical protein
VKRGVVMVKQSGLCLPNFRVTSLHVFMQCAKLIVKCFLGGRIFGGSTYIEKNMCSFGRRVLSGERGWQFVID